LHGYRLRDFAGKAAPGAGGTSSYRCELWHRASFWRLHSEGEGTRCSEDVTVTSYRAVTMTTRERLLPGLKNRILQILARIAPGATTTRVRLNRWRGVNIGKDVWIGYDAIIETSRPHLVTIRDRAAIGIRVTIIAHNREQQGVVIEEDVTLGAGVIVLPDVTIGRGAMVTAGSVVTKSVPPRTMVQGNPAKPIATVEVPFGVGVSLKEFAKGLRPIR
jgi:acetyltransferase-like isoleucine patch superfamily enzyme